MKTRLVTFDTHFFLRFIFEQLDIVLSQKSSTLCRHNEPRAHWLGLLSPCYCHADRVAGDKLCCQSAGLKNKNHHPYIRAGVCEHRLYSQTSSSRSITALFKHRHPVCSSSWCKISPVWKSRVWTGVHAFKEEKHRWTSKQLNEICNFKLRAANTIHLLEMACMHAKNPHHYK